MQNFDPLVVHSQGLSIGVESFGRPVFNGESRGLAGGGAHPFQDAVVGENRRTPAVGHGVGKVRIPKRIGENGQPGFGQLAISAHVIRLCARINNVASGQFGQFSDRGQNAVGGAFGTRIHQHDAIDPDLDTDISPSPDEDVKVRPNLHNIQPAVRLLTASDRGCAKDNQNPSGPHASREC